MYEKRNPNKKVLEGVVEWMKRNGIRTYTGNCDLENGIRYPSLMDVEDAETMLAIAKRNKDKSWTFDDDPFNEM